MERIIIRLQRALAALACLGLVSACGVNPVTGARELQLVSEAQEIRIGEENYLFARQAQGGAYTLDPGLTEYVNEVGARLVQVSDRPDLPYEFVVVNDGTPNAWALPGGKIAVNRGLLTELDSEAELAAVLAHEIVHAAARHGAKSMERNLALQAGVFAVGAAVAGGDHPEYADLAVGAASLASTLIHSTYSRGAELEADRYGMEYMARAGYDPAAAVDLQQTFVRLAARGERSWLAGLFATHPPSAERVAANRETAARLGGGERFQERYQERIAGLKRVAPAYAKFEQGREALAAGDFERAYVLGREAVAIEPREGHFHSLLGDARLGQKRYREAVEHYDEALARNDRFYYYYRQRGLARRQLQDPAGARQDLQKSIALLPTAAAHYALGELALAGRESRLALEHFRAAAGADSEIGRRARAQLVRLDLPANPDRYLQVAAGTDPTGRVLLRVANRSPVAVSDLVIDVGGFDRGGRLLVRDRVVVGALGAGQVVTRPTRIPAGGGVVDLRTDVRRARVAD